MTNSALDKEDFCRLVEVHQSALYRTARSILSNQQDVEDAVQEDDYDTTVGELNQNGFFVTMLSSTGGFWKKKNITIMLGVEESRLDEALSILKQCAGKRKQTIYSNVTMPTGSQYAVAMPSVPVNVELGGVTVFIMDLERLEKL